MLDIASHFKKIIYKTTTSKNNIIFVQKYFPVFPDTQGVRDKLQKSDQLMHCSNKLC